MTDITIEALKLRRRALEINIAMNQGALEEIDNIIGEMERRRGGRPRKTAEVSVMPQRQATDTTNGPVGVAGAMFETPTEESAA